MNLEGRKELFLRKARDKWGDMYDYSNVGYVNARTEVEIVNKENGRTFKIAPWLHLRYGGGRQDKHKECGYWNDKELCKKESLKYGCKYDFERRCYGAYNAARRNGWLDEFFQGKGVVGKFQNAENRIHCVYVYEIEGFNTCYVGRTSRINIRDRQHRNGVLRHGAAEHDGLYKFCNEHGIEIPRYKILEDKLTAIESQKAEEKWLKEYICKGWNALNKGAVGVGKGSLGSALKWTYERCLEESRKYHSRSAFKNGNMSAYNSAKRNGWLNDLYPIVLKKENGYWNKLENCQDAASKCNGAKELAKRFGGCYNAVRKNNWGKCMKYK